MKLNISLTSLGVEISADDSRPTRLEPDPQADQQAPRRSYVYGHIRADGTLFYVGKGAGRRAWSEDRHPLWRRYVDKHLHGRYEVRILRDNLSPEEAEQLEADWMAQHSASLVNWVSAGRSFDEAILKGLGRLSSESIKLQEQARSLEKTDPEAAVALYRSALAVLGRYAKLDYEPAGLVGQLRREEQQELGVRGDIAILDRLSLTLVKHGRASEAKSEADGYFELYKADRARPVAGRIIKRIEKALAKKKARPIP